MAFVINVIKWLLWTVEITVSPRINVHALIFDDALSFRKQVHALIFEHDDYFRKNTCTYIRTNDKYFDKKMQFCNPICLIKKDENNKILAFII